jgi:hypothetical protein
MVEKREMYIRITNAIDPILTLGSLTYGDYVETAWAVEAPLEKEAQHLRDTGLQNRLSDKKNNRF